MQIFFTSSSTSFTVVPFHPERDISPILLKQIAKDIGLTVEEFIRYK
jgi:predicted RNA binding protein YcfA (HicA-like mRNA interferase family)